MPAQLRLLPVPDEFDTVSPPEPCVRIRLGDLLPLVDLARRNRYIWLEDFIDDEVTVTSDLYDVLQAFRSMRTPAA